MSSRHTAFITGIGGQDGSYLADLLLGKGYRVVGIQRSDEPARGADLPARIAHLAGQVELIDGNLLDMDSMVSVLGSVRPTEVYNLAGHSFVPSSWDEPGLVGDATGVGAVRLLEAIRVVDPGIRFYQASSSEIFGNALEVPQTETTPLNPRNPYGAAKAFAHFAVGNARDHTGLYAVSGILYNHESPRRGQQFLTRKVTIGAARIALGRVKSLMLGGLDSERDWGFAGDYVDAMWRMLQTDQPSDYVIATGVTHTVRDVCRIAFERLHLNYERYVTVDPALVRPPEDVRLVGDATKARAELSWAPTVTFEELIEMMVDADLERERAGGVAPESLDILGPR